MVNISITYRFIASLLCITLFSGIALPAFGLAETMEHCSDMMEINEEVSHHDEHMMPGMNHSEMNESCMKDMTFSVQESSLQHCETSIDCDCDFEADAINPGALIIQKTKIPQVFPETIVLPSFHIQVKNIPPPLWHSNSYSPPLLFLTNESFLI